MAKLGIRHSKRFQQAYKELLEVSNHPYFVSRVDGLVSAVQDETEFALMRGKVRFLGEPYMLYRALESVVGQERRPVHRDAAIKAISCALSHYLGLKFTPGMRKRKRRELLSHV